MRATLVVAASVTLASCTSGGTTANGPAARSDSLAQSIECSATKPNGSNPPGRRSRLSHGNGKLWVGLWPRGHVRASEVDVRANGSIAIKFPWTRGVRGKLKITGRRLDGNALALGAVIPNGYGNTGFQPSGIIFPTEGCWEITGRAGEASLTFVTEVTMPRGTEGVAD